MHFDFMGALVPFLVIAVPGGLIAYWMARRGSDD